MPPRRPHPDFPQVERAIATFPDKLQRVLNARGQSQMSLGAAIGSSQSNIVWWLRGKSLPRIDTLIKLCVYLNVSPAWFLSLEDLETSEERQERLAALSDKLNKMATQFAELTAIAPELANDAAVTDHTPSGRKSGAIRRLVRSSNVNQGHATDGVDLVKHPRKGSR